MPAFGSTLPRETQAQILLQSQIVTEGSSLKWAGGFTASVGWVLDMTEVKFNKTPSPDPHYTDAAEHTVPTVLYLLYRTYYTVPTVHTVPALAVCCSLFSNMSTAYQNEKHFDL